MIVTCPNCSARYRIPDTAGTARMRCAACQHRWMPGERDVGTPLPLAGGVGGENALAAQSQIEEARPLLANTGITDDEHPQAGAESHHGILATIAAIVVGLALAVAAAGLWVDDATRAQLAAVPGIGELLARIDPAPSPLKITLHGQVTAMGGNNRLLEVNGMLTNPTDAPQPVPALAATLSGPAGVALRWTITPPAAAIPPHGSAAFTSTVTGFPADATRLSVTPG